MYEPRSPFECETPEEQYYADRAQRRLDTFRRAAYEAVKKAASLAQAAAALNDAAFAAFIEEFGP